MGESGRHAAESNEEHFTLTESVRAGVGKQSWVRVLPCLVFGNILILDPGCKNHYDPWTVSKMSSIMRKRVLIFWELHCWVSDSQYRTTRCRISPLSLQQWWPRDWRTVKCCLELTSVVLVSIPLSSVWDSLSGTASQRVSSHGTLVQSVWCICSHPHAVQIIFWHFGCTFFNCTACHAFGRSKGISGSMGSDLRIAVVTTLVQLTIKEVRSRIVLP